MFVGLAGAAHYIGREIALGALQELELNCFTLIQGSVTVFLDSGEMDEHILSGGTLNESISFCTVEPLNCTLLSHSRNSFRLSQNEISPVFTHRERERLLLCRFLLQRKKVAEAQ